MVRPLEAVADRHLAREQVDQRPGNEERRDPPRPACSLISTAVSAIEVSPPIPEPIITPVRSASPPPRAPPSRHPRTACVRRGDAIEDEVVDLALFLRLHPVVGIEAAVRAVAPRHLASVFGRRRSPASNRVIVPAPTLAGDEPRPARLDPEPSGVTSPSPVTTTRRMPVPFSAWNLRPLYPFPVGRSNPPQRRPAEPRVRSGRSPRQAVG